MISEIIFAKGYTSFWSEHTPWLKDYYTSIQSLVKRVDAPIDLPEDKSHVYINNIIATTHFKNLSLNLEYSVEQSFIDCKPVLKVFGEEKLKNFEFTGEYKKNVKKQAARLTRRYTGEIIHAPSFPGCGLMANCRGDLLCGNTLVEIKARTTGSGRKPFHPEDFKQLLVYCALNYLAGDAYDIQKIELYNPREGYLWESDVSEFIFLVSNSTAASLFEQTGQFLSALGESIDLT